MMKVADGRMSRSAPRSPRPEYGKQKEWSNSLIMWTLQKNNWQGTKVFHLLEKRYFWRDSKQPFNKDREIRMTWSVPCFHVLLI